MKLFYLRTDVCALSVLVWQNVGQSTVSPCSGTLTTRSRVAESSSHIFLFTPDMFIGVPVASPSYTVLKVRFFRWHAITKPEAPGTAPRIKEREKVTLLSFIDLYRLCL